VRRLLLPLALLLGLLLAACGNSGGSATSSSTTASTTTSTTAAKATSSTTTSSGGGNAAGNVPAVAAPTDLTTEPVISPGTPPPPTSLVTKDLVVGTGATASASSTVSVKYVGASYTTGKNFTATTWTENRPTSFALTTVVPGFSQGIVGMKVGGRREIVIPPALGYGSHGSGSVIKPNETLVFVVDLKAVS
jgi:FKBP-type peptidyl-prolyl cis-trans isomerase